MFVVKTVRKNFPESLMVMKELAILEDAVRIQQMPLKEQIDDIMAKIKLLSAKMRKHKSSVATLRRQHTSNRDRVMPTPKPTASSTMKNDRFEEVMSDFLLSALSESKKISEDYQKAGEQTKLVLLSVFPYFCSFFVLFVKQ